MDYNTASILLVILMLFLLFIGVPIAYSLGFSAMLIGSFAFGSICLQKAGWTTFALLYNLAWTPLPLFTLMAYLISETPIGEDIYKAARAWFSRVPGGIIIASVMGEAGIAAALGNSSATIISVGKISVPEFRRYGYDETIGLGALTVGGILGPLIPPSGTMIIYSVLGNVPLGHLFIAGVIPGILLAVMLCIVPLIRCSINPSLGPPAGKVRWKERFSSLKRVWPVALVMVCILGSIYFGIATPTEAGGVGSFVILIVAVAVYGLRKKGFLRAITETAKINAMITVILVSSTFFSYVLGSSAIAEKLTILLGGLGVPPIVLIILIMIFLLFLGCFIDGTSIMFITIPILVPLVKGLGFDPVWFGVLFVVNLEMALITPPMAINFFIVRSTFEISSRDLLRGVWPFMGVVIIFLLIILLFPKITLWLPSMMLTR
ncbi:MAG: TRAP transporter large permease [Deltaproteobacteria bacterium]|nr:TRAP transporter large permease [Deltaproteobacteria bacterium]